jgi:hypothetical protein
VPSGHLGKTISEPIVGGVICFRGTDHARLSRS